MSSFVRAVVRSVSLRIMEEGVENDRIDELG